MSTHHSMKAMVLNRAGEPLEITERPVPQPDVGQVLIQVRACGVCRTDLHVYDGELTEPNLPLILGHQIVGRVIGVGEGVEEVEIGQRIGVPWLGSTCGSCRYCESDRENLCDHARFTGYQIDGGYATCTVAEVRFCFPIPDDYSDAEAAPLLCAGLIGYRALRMAGAGQRLGVYGFGAAGHIVSQIALYQGRTVYAFTRPGDAETQQFARSLGAQWASGSDEMPPEELDAALIFAPVGPLVPQALRAVCKGGTVICAGIHMSPIPEFPYEWLWGERSVKSVANLTRRDGIEFFEIAPQVPVRTEVTTYTLSQANEALRDLKQSRIQGAAVLVMDSV